jgi:hypothetical protein
MPKLFYGFVTEGELNFAGDREGNPEIKHQVGSSSDLHTLSEVATGLGTYVDAAWPEGDLPDGVRLYIFRDDDRIDPIVFGELS